MGADRRTLVDRPVALPRDVPVAFRRPISDPRTNINQPLLGLLLGRGRYSSDGTRLFLPRYLHAP